MIITKQEMKNYVVNLANAKPYYMWGYDMDIINDASLKAHYAKYGKEKYKDAEKKKGFLGCDCSGLMTKISGIDLTAAMWYNKCKEKGKYSQCKSDFCLVFKVRDSKIVHMGIKIDGKTYEMYNRLDVKDAKGGSWDYYGVPEIFEKVPSKQEQYYTVKQRCNGYTTAAAAASDNSKIDVIVTPGRYHIYNEKTVNGIRCVNVTAQRDIPGAWIKA